MTSSPKLAVRLDDEAYARLRDYCDRKNITISEAVRKAIDKLVGSKSATMRPGNPTFGKS